MSSAILHTKRRKDKKDVTFFGMTVSSEAASFLSLYCTAKAVTKTSIVSTLLDKWLKEAQSIYDRNELINEIAQKAIEEFPYHKSVNINSYLHLLKIELIQKGLCKEDFKEILQIVENDKSTKS